jgi:hypothetical protein
MNPFVKFMVSPAGRITRIIAGIALIALGALVVHGVGGIVLMVVGLLPLVAGLFDFCAFAHCSVLRWVASRSVHPTKTFTDSIE